MIVDHIKKASRELSLHISMYYHDQKPLVLDFTTGYFYLNRLYYVFKVTLNPYKPDLLGIIGGYETLDPRERAIIYNAQYLYEPRLAAPLIRLLNTDNPFIYERTLMYYHPTRPDELVGPDNRYVFADLHFDRRLEAEMEGNNPIKDFAFSSYNLQFPVIRHHFEAFDAGVIDLTNMTFAHVLLKTGSFALEDFINLFERQWSERLRPDNYNIVINKPTIRPEDVGRVKKLNKCFNFEIENGMTLTIRVSQSSKFIKALATHYSSSLLEPNLMDLAHKTHKVLQVTCHSKKCSLIDVSRFLVKAVTALCDLFNVLGIITNNFVYRPKMYKMVALASLNSSVDYFSWFPAFNVLGIKLRPYAKTKRISASTIGMHRYKLLDIYIAPCDLRINDIVNLICTIARASYENDGHINDRNFFVKGINCQVHTSIERSARTKKRYIRATVGEFYITEHYII